MKYPIRLGSVMLALVIGAGCAMTVASEAPAADSATPQTLTVFVDATLGFRKDSMAEKLTESHARQAARGYRFAGFEAYNENGDLQGFFITYVQR